MLAVRSRLTPSCCCGRALQRDREEQRRIDETLEAERLRKIDEERRKEVRVVIGWV